MQLRQVEPPAPEGTSQGGWGSEGEGSESGGRGSTVSTPCCGVSSSAVQDPGTGLDELEGSRGASVGSKV